MANQLPRQSELEPHIFEWFGRDVSGSARVLWDLYKARYTAWYAAERSIPIPPVGNFTPLTRHEIVVVRELLMNIVVQGCEDPLTIELFTTSHRPRTMTGYKFMTVEVMEYPFYEVCGNGTIPFRLSCRREVLLSLNRAELRYGFRSLLLAKIELVLVTGIADLAEMLNRRRICLVEENSFGIEGSLKVLLPESGNTWVPVSSCELTWNFEETFLQGIIQGPPKYWESFGNELDAFMRAPQSHDRDVFLDRFLIEL
jgi:hypothetical protein